MIPFEELVAALERFKQRRLAAAANSGPNKATSGKPGQPPRQQMQVTELGDDLIHE